LLIKFTDSFASSPNLRIDAILLNRRFGEINSSLIDRIKLLPIEKLDTLAEALLDFSAVSDLIAWLEQNTSS
jgi:Domain of unknown function (DUF4351)